MKRGYGRQVIINPFTKEESVEDRLQHFPQKTNKRRSLKNVVESAQTSEYNEK